MQVNHAWTEDEYAAALAELSSLIDLDPEPQSAEGQRITTLGSLVALHESRLYDQ